MGKNWNGKYGYKEELLRIFAEESEAGNIQGLRDMVKRQDEFIDQINWESLPCNKEDYKEVPYSTFHSWVKNTDYEQYFAANPALEAKKLKEEEKEEKEEKDPPADPEEGSSKKGDQEQEGKGMELKDRIKDLERKKTENPHRKQVKKAQEKTQTPKEQEEKPAGDKMLNIFFLVGVAGIVIGGGYFIYTKLKAKESTEPKVEETKVEGGQEYERGSSIPSVRDLKRR